MFGIGGVALAGIRLTRRMGYVAIYTCGALVLNLALNILLIPSWGMMGAAFATLAAYAMIAVLFYHRAQILYPTPYALRKTLTVIAAGQAATLVGLVRFDGLGLAIGAKFATLVLFALSLWVFGVVDRTDLEGLRLLVRRPVVPSPAPIAAQAQDVDGAAVAGSVADAGQLERRSRRPRLAAREGCRTGGARRGRIVCRHALAPARGSRRPGQPLAAGVDRAGRRGGADHQWRARRGRRALRDPRRSTAHGAGPRLVGSADDGATQRSFGAKWDQYDKPDKERLAEFQYHWFDQRFGFAAGGGFADFLAGKRWVLDAGTGPGLCAARCATLSDARVAGMDLSESVTAAASTYGGRANLDYVQGDILNPPFARGAFDLVVADKVLHHTPDTVGAFRAMAELVAPDGELAVYVYRRKPIIRELVDDHVIDLTSRLSFDECLELSEQLTELGRELSQLNAKVTLEQGVPLLGIEPGEHDVQRLIYWTMLKCFWNEELGWHQSVMVNYDWYSPVYRSRHSEEEVLGWCSDAGLEVVHLDVIESGISVRARRPRGA